MRVTSCRRTSTAELLLPSPRAPFAWRGGIGAAQPSLFGGAEVRRGEKHDRPDRCQNDDRDEQDHRTLNHSTLPYGNQTASTLPGLMQFLGLSTDPCHRPHI